MNRQHLNLPHPAKHGEFVPGQGWYDANNRWWLDDPKRLGADRTNPPAPTESQREEFRRMQDNARGTFRANPELEQLRTLRDSDRPELREKAENLLAGRRRLQLAEYEAAKREHVAEGGKLPEGVAAPSSEGAA